MTAIRRLLRHRRSVVPTSLLALAALAVTLSPPQRAEAADDIDLLRENGGNPYVMILLDTSASMALAPPTTTQNKDLGDLLPADGDDPDSKLFQVKQALYEVFSNVENVNYGFATYNMDRARVQAKHWLYAPVADGAFSNSNVTYPTAPASGATQRARLDSDWVLGQHYNAGVAGTCLNPIDFDKNNGHIKLNRFPKIGVTGLQDTVMWASIKNKTYRITVSRSNKASIISPADGITPIANGNLGDATILLDVDLHPTPNCANKNGGPSETITVPFKRVTDFLLVESDASGGGANVDAGIVGTAVPMINNNFLSANCKDDETVAGFWDFQDIAAEGTCGGGVGADGPFTGRGWESNGDSGARPSQTNVDPFCQAFSGCYNLRRDTVLHPSHPELDFGDHIPMDWEVDHREAFLARLNPRHPDYDATRAEDYFGVARFFEDTPDSSGVLKLKNTEERPIMAFGSSPLARALNDFRCWYLGPTSSGNGKCRATDTSYDPGWEALFKQFDEAYKCRIPYLIIITDGEDTSATGENPTADISDFDGKAGIRTYVFSFQDTPALNSLFKTQSEGELILVSNKNDLKTKLEEVIGTITQATRTFATAAVPSVQTAVQNQIYLTKFQPLNDAGVWEGHLHAFRRPMPQGQPEAPNRDYPNHIWDAALAMLNQSSQPAANGDNSTTDLKVGLGENRRRVLFARERLPGDPTLGGLPAVRELLDRTTGASGGDVATDLEKDFWAGLDIAFDAADPTSVKAVRSRANKIVEETLVQKLSNVVSNTDDLDYYILGEIFHSNPLIIGGPVNTKYFVEDAEQTYDGAGVPQGTGYREFFNKHENRRKVVIAGANDGMIHAFDAGRATVNHTVDPPVVEFNTGTGKEIFSFIPRAVLPTVKLQAENPQTHRWSLDGSPSAADVFIDPKHSGTPTVADREWRTVVVTGLREGGTAYFALDMTRPDPLKIDTIGPANDPIAQRDVYIPTSQNDVVPICYGVTGDGDLGCDDQVTYPAPLWEFTDRVWDDPAKEWVKLDEDDVDGNGFEDGNGYHDIGETWSTPSIGRIRAVENGNMVNKYVAIFGGGLDPAKAASRGNWLYIVDIETGEAIYKRELEGSAPSDPAAVDTDQDGYIDRVYIGTTAGFMYRLDLTSVDNAGNVIYPALATERVRGINGLTYDVTRIEKGSDLANPLWAPKKIFDANVYLLTETIRRPIYFPPAVLFVADLGEYALAFGTGDRDDLTSKTGSTGRFYVFVDETEQLPDSDLPMVESRFTQITRFAGDNPNLLTDPNIPVGQKGWYLVLNDKERLIGDPFGFSGITFFASFEPSISASCSVTCDKNDATCTPCVKPDNDGILDPDESPQCTLGGLSRIYVVGTTDGDAFLEDPITGALVRSFDIKGQFVTSPFTEQAVTTVTTSQDGSTQVEADPLTDAEKKLTQKLMELFPQECKFGNHRIDIKVVQANSEIQRIATVPICIIEKNWKEVSE